MTNPPEHLKHITPDEHDAPDQWHKHTAEEKPQHAHGEIANAGVIIGVGIFMFLGLVATIAITYGYYVWYTARLLDEQELVDMGRGLEKDALEYKGTMETDFKGYHWVAEDAPIVPKDTAQIPLQVAMKKVAAQYAARKD